MPEYRAWLKALPVGDLRMLYQEYRRQVQHLQLFDRRGHWLSKAYSHLRYMSVLHDVFPGANEIGATPLDMFVDGMDRLMRAPQPVAAERAINMLQRADRRPGGRTHRRGAPPL